MEDTNESFDILSVNGQNLINTFGPVTFIGGVSVEPLTGAGIIDEALTLVNDKLAEFAASPTFETDMQTVFGESVDVDLGRTIIDALSLGGELPEITVVPAEKMNGIDGGFDSLTGRVYLADTLINPNSVIWTEPASVIASGTKQSPNLADVLIEEFGHLLDWRLNQTDTPGDEGELFAALVRGDELSGPEILEFKDEDDRAQINLGQTVEVEASSRQKKARVQPSFREAFGSQVGEYPTTVAIGEFNRDGVADLAVTHWFSTDVSVLLGNQGGGFAKAANFFDGGHFLEAVALGEFDGDGALDLTVANLANTSMLLGHGDGSFGDATGFNTAQNPKSVAVGEFNGDGFLDAAVVNVNSHNLSVLLGKGDGSFEEPVHFDAGQHPKSVAVGEFNSDNVLDLAVVNDLDVLILLGDGEGGFSKKGYVDPGYGQRSVAVGEFNGDGISDLAVVDSYHDKVSVMLGDGKGDFGRPNYLDLGTYDSPWSVAAGEINGDGLQDLAVVYPWSEKVSVLLNTTPVEPYKPKVSISNTRITEGNKGTKDAKFTVSLDRLTLNRVELDYATANDTAKAGRDYKNTKGTLIFNPGEISKTIAVPVLGDKRVESQEQFKLKLSNPTNAELVDGEAIATIRDKDVARVSINNTKIEEGDDGSKEARFKVFLNTKSSKEVEVSYATVDDSAKAGEDYEATEGTLTFKPGQRSKVIRVPVFGDDVDEDNERFFVELGDAKNAKFKDKRAVGRIVDNDTDTEDEETEENNNGSDVPEISIRDQQVVEGDSGSQQATFSVFLDTASSQEVEVSYTTADNSAKAGEDYETTEGTLTFKPGEQEKVISVPILGDDVSEETEFFLVHLSDAKNGEIERSRAIARISDNDDGEIEDGSDVAKVSIQDLEILEDNTGKKQAKFKVFLDAASSKEVEVSYATADDSAKEGEDYEATEGTLIFEPGEIDKVIEVSVLGDILDEDSEHFFVNLTDAKNGEIDRKRAVARIVDNDTTPETDGSEWNASFYKFTGDKPPIDFHQNDSQKLTVLNLGSSENGFNKNWGSGSPSNIPQDKFAVRSYTHADFEEGKVYKARVRADDGYQLLAKHHTLPEDDPNKWIYITSKDEWREDAYGEYQEIEFTVPNSGKYDLHFHYYENVGDAYFDLSWEEVDSKPVVAADFEEVYERNKDKLGAPTEKLEPYKSYEFQTFDNGSIVKSDRGIFAIYGDIRIKYTENTGGGLEGPLRAPINEQYEWKGGWRQDFESGYIFLGSDSKAYYVFGDFNDVYKENEETLGVPKSDIDTRTEGYEYQQFSGGSIVKNKNVKDGENIFVLYGKIREVFLATENGLNGPLRGPTSDRYEWEGSTRQDFENGYILLKDGNATAYIRFTDGSFVAYETPLADVDTPIVDPPDKEDLIPIEGAIGGLYENIGADNSWLGKVTQAQWEDDDGVTIRQEFENGEIVFNRFTDETETIAKGEKSSWDKYEVITKDYVYTNPNKVEDLGYEINLVIENATTGMYAMGLFPKNWDEDANKNKPPVLVFRGTEPIDIKQRDIVDDLNPRGIGYAQFNKKQAEIEDWLKQAEERKGIKPDVIGHSLGGALAQRTAGYFTDKVGKVITFNAPGIENESVEKFQNAGGEEHTVIHYRTDGDIVPYGGEKLLPGKFIKIEGDPVSVKWVNTLILGPQNSLIIGYVRSLLDNHLKSGLLEDSSRDKDVWDSDYIKEENRQKIESIRKATGQARITAFWGKATYDLIISAAKGPTNFAQEAIKNPLVKQGLEKITSFF